MDQYTVFVTDQAQEQMSSTRLYYKYKLHAPDAATDFIDRMEEVFADLETYPNRGRLVDEEPWHSQNIHIRPVKNHLVYYWINEEEKSVWIVAVIDERMDQQKQLRKMLNSKNLQE